MSRKQPHTATHPELRSDPVIDAFKEGIDMSLVRENLKLSPDQRMRRMLRFIEDSEQIRGAARHRR